MHKLRFKFITGEQQSQRSVLLAVEAADGDSGDEGEDPDEERDGEKADLHPVNAFSRLY